MADQTTPTPPTPQTPPLPGSLAKYDPDELKLAYERAQEALRTQGVAPWARFGSLGHEVMSFEDAIKTPGLVERVITQGASPTQMLGLPGLSEVKRYSKQIERETRFEEAAARTEKRTNAFADLMNQQYGFAYDEATGKISVDPNHPFQVTKRLKAEREQQALEGKLPVPGGLEEDLRKGEATLRATLLDRLGPGWETSTPGQTALAEYTKQANLARDAARRGDIAQFSGLSAAARSEPTSVGVGQPNLAYAGLLGQAASLGQANLGYAADIRQQADQMALYRQQIQAQQDAAERQAQYSLYGGLANLGLTAALGFGGYGAGAAGLGLAGASRYGPDAWSSGGAIRPRGGWGTYSYRRGY